MPKPIRSPEDLARGPYEISNFPDLIPDSTVAFAMCKAVPEIVEEVGDSAHLNVTYGSLKIENGMTLSPDLLVEEPDISITPQGTYTLMVVDPDAPTPNNPNQRSWLHWLVINIPSNDVPRGEVVMGYEPPSPAGDKHRCLYLLFEQHGRVKARTPSSRKGFQVKEWAKQHDLGTPANGLFIWAAVEHTDEL